MLVKSAAELRCPHLPTGIAERREDGRAPGTALTPRSVSRSECRPDTGAGREQPCPPRGWWQPAHAHGGRAAGLQQRRGEHAGSTWGARGEHAGPETFSCTKQHPAPPRPRDARDDSAARTPLAPVAPHSVRPARLYHPHPRAHARGRLPQRRVRRATLGTSLLAKPGHQTDPSASVRLPWVSNAKTSEQVTVDPEHRRPRRAPSWGVGAAGTCGAATWVDAPPVGSQRLGPALGGGRASPPAAT